MSAQLQALLLSRLSGAARAKQAVIDLMTSQGHADASKLEQINTAHIRVECLLDLCRELDEDGLRELNEIQTLYPLALPTNLINQVIGQSSDDIADDISVAA
jgi:hypothetical protein